MAENPVIFVTGGTGFLGRHLVPALCRAGYHLRVLARRPADHTWLARYPNVEVIQGDILEAGAVQTAVQGCQFVIHAAGYFRFWGDEHDFDRTNVGGTENVLAAALRADVERFIYVSTVAVIGQPLPDQLVDETHPACPADAYQRSKLRAETLVLDTYHERNLPVVILRPGAFYGPLGHYAFNRLFFRDPMRGIIMQVDGGKYRIFPVYIADVAQGILKALDRGRAGEIYNICGDSISHKQAFDIICNAAGLHWPRLPIPGWLGVSVARLMDAAAKITRREPFWPLNLHSYVYNDWRVSYEKARRELDFVPTDFQEGARRTIAWYRAGQPDLIPELDC
jgi:nucleoside-diphosphate-sugar epimerase